MTSPAGRAASRDLDLQLRPDGGIQESQLPPGFTLPQIESMIRELRTAAALEVGGILPLSLNLQQIFWNLLQLNIHAVHVCSCFSLSRCRKAAQQYHWMHNPRHVPRLQRPREHSTACFDVDLPALHHFSCTAPSFWLLPSVLHLVSADAANDYTSTLSQWQEAWGSALQIDLPEHDASTLSQWHEARGSAL